MISRILLGVGDPNGFWPFVTNNYRLPLIMTIDLHNDDIDQRKCPKSFSRKPPGVNAQIWL